jgi:CheY-like chemotaxis protein
LNLPADSYVLVVEDDAPIRAALLDVLAAEGVAVRPAGNGHEALKTMATHGVPGLILLDLMMPEMDGPTFLLHQRADPALSAIPVVIMTASERGDVTHLLNPAALLRKPFTIHELLLTLAPWIAQPGEEAIPVRP